MSKQFESRVQRGLTHAHSPGKVELKKTHGRAPRRSDASDGSASSTKVFMPLMTAWVKQLDDLP